MYPCGSSRPLASNLNYVAGAAVPNTVVIGLDTAGTICLFSQLDTHVVVDVTAAFDPQP